MNDNVYLIKRINEMRKEEHELQKQIEVLSRGAAGTGNEEMYENEQRKDLELMDLTIDKWRQELDEAQKQHEQLRIRRPPRNLAPLQNGQMPPQMDDIDGQQDPGLYQQQDQQDYQMDDGSMGQQMDHQMNDNQQQQQQEMPDDANMQVQAETSQQELQA